MKKISSSNSGLTPIDAVLIFGVLLSACAPIPSKGPLTKQLNDQHFNKIQLIVEKEPFEYTVPSQIDGWESLGAVGALAAMVVQNKLVANNKQLIEAAQQRTIANNYRNDFLNKLIQELSDRGIKTEIVSAPFKPRGFGWRDYRIMYIPDMSGIVTSSEALPAFALRLDFGSCTIRVITPCIRSAFFNIRTGEKNQASIPSRITITTKEEPTENAKFSSVEDAVTHIADFDIKLGKLVPKAVNQLVEKIDTEK